MRLIINTDSDAKGKELAKFLRSVKYVKSVELDDMDTPLTEEDWIKPGRPATEEEMEAMAKAMDEDSDEGIPTDQLKKEMRQWIGEVTR
jgi:phage terminase small subunit